MIDPDALARFGPFFVVTTHSHVLESPWQPMSELVTDPARMAARVVQVRDALAASAGRDEIEMRVGASVAQLGLIARLAAPALALAVLDDPDPVIDLTKVYWQAELGGPFPLSLPLTAASDHPRPATTRSDRAPSRIGLAAFLEGPVLALVEATLGTASIAPHVLWGNVASAINSAGQMMANTRPEFAHRAVRAAADALTHPLLQAEHEQLDGRFRRRSCCLIYRIAESASAGSRSVCGDCALTA